ncbi:MAG: hypothetical protein M5U19_11030 [Microthrixaceae bacterium]|nr:hypothetical protein [Microthrixaceae bacterium]
MPHTTGTASLVPARPSTIWRTIVVRSATRFMPLWASSRTNTRSVVLLSMVRPMISHIEYSRRLLPPWESPCVLRQLLDVQEVDATGRQLAVEEVVAQLDQPCRLELLGCLEHLGPGLAVERRVVGHPQERDVRVGVAVEVR